MTVDADAADVTVDDAMGAMRVAKVAHVPNHARAVVTIPGDVASEAIARNAASAAAATTADPAATGRTRAQQPLRSGAPRGDPSRAANPGGHRVRTRRGR